MARFSKLRAEDEDRGRLALIFWSVARVAPPAAGWGQSPDFDAMRAYRGVTKWVSQINQTERIPEMMRRAYTRLRSGRGAP